MKSKNEKVSIKKNRNKSGTIENRKNLCITNARKSKENNKKLKNYIPKLCNYQKRFYIIKAL